MRRKNKKTAVRVVFSYIVLTAGLWMFMFSYANSYNKLNEEKIVPASLTVTSSCAELTILGRRFTLGNSFSPESRLYLTAYLLAADELRAAAVILSALH